VVYYNQAQLNGAWSGEIALGSGSDPRIAIDADNNAHVVYVTTDNKIAYLTSGSEGFTTPVYINSQQRWILFQTRYRRSMATDLPISLIPIPRETRVILPTNPISCMLSTAVAIL